jgi:hypothetical protein
MRKLPLLLVLALVPTSAHAEYIRLDFNVPIPEMTWGRDEVFVDNYGVGGIYIPGQTMVWDSNDAHEWGDAQGGTGYAKNGSGLINASSRGVTVTSEDPFVLKSAMLLQGTGSGVPGASAVTVKGFLNGL